MFARGNDPRLSIRPGFHPIIYRQPDSTRKRHEEQRDGYRDKHPNDDFHFRGGVPHFGEELRKQVGGNEQPRRYSVIDDHGADEVARLAEKFQAAPGAIMIHRENAPEKMSLTAARAAKAQTTLQYVGKRRLGDW